MYRKRVSIPNAVEELDYNYEVCILQEVLDLPIHLINSNRIYLDFETTSGDDDKTSLSPWHDCKVLGICITADDFPDAYYIPLRHREPSSMFPNLPIKPVMAWLLDVISTCKEWVNHNIKYDAHALYNETSIYPKCRLVDTLVLAKLYDSNKFMYNLASSMSEDLSYDIKLLEHEMKKYLCGSKDYAVVPIDKMAIYGTGDAIAVKLLYEFYMKEIPEECTRIREIEIDLTHMLFDMENVGMRLDRKQVVHDMVLFPRFLGELKRSIMDELNVSNFRPHVNADCQDLICGTMGLPAIEFTEKTKKPSFSAKALEGYRNMTQDHIKVIHYLANWKKYYKLYTSFVKPYYNNNIDNVLYPDYNQIISTGRMSCRNPNAQQLPPLAKVYIVPPEGYSILDIDFSQIEFRVIVHYAKDTRCIQAYKNDPNTDFHKWVQQMCNLTRPQAKTLNFRLGYGGGKRSTAMALTTTPGFMEDDEDIEWAIKRGEKIYENYYEQLPTLKNTRWRASQTLRSRGYTKTIMGRHRHLPEKAAFKAFNSSCQGTAADLMKAATVRLKPYLDLHPEVQLFGLVHDSWCFYVPTEEVEQIAKEVIEIVEQIPDGIDFRVPIKADYKHSNKNWMECE
jgi:DNA polymerase-1